MVCAFEPYSCIQPSRRESWLHFSGNTMFVCCVDMLRTHSRTFTTLRRSDAVIGARHDFRVVSRRRARKRACQPRGITAAWRHGIAMASATQTWEYGALNSTSSFGSRSDWSPQRLPANSAKFCEIARESKELGYYVGQKERSTSLILEPSWLNCLTRRADYFSKSDWIKIIIAAFSDCIWTAFDRTITSKFCICCTEFV